MYVLLVTILMILYSFAFMKILEFDVHNWSLTTEITLLILAAVFFMSIILIVCTLATRYHDLKNQNFDLKKQLISERCKNAKEKDQDTI